MNDKSVKKDKKNLQDILDAITAHPKGALIADIISSMKSPLVQRTLQRRLQGLVNEGVVAREGQGRATRYFLIHPEQSSFEDTQEPLKSYPLSSDKWYLLGTQSAPSSFRDYLRQLQGSGHFATAEPTPTYKRTHNIEKPITHDEQTSPSRSVSKSSSRDSIAGSPSYIISEPSDKHFFRGAKEILHYVTQPLSQREPVTYNRDFLYDYVPNKTFYLDQTTRDYLHQVGKETHSVDDTQTFIQKIYHRLLIDLSFNSSRLEGNTYSLLETERLIDESKAADGKDVMETLMIMNHKDAIEFLVSTGNKLFFDNYVIFGLHAFLASDLLPNRKAIGALRDVPVGVGRTSYTPINIPILIKEYFEKILTTANEIDDPFEQSFFAMVHIPYLQGFEDVNKRVSRLSANIPLIKNDLCPISFVDVSKQDYINAILGVYELNRTELLAELYVNAYDNSSLRYSEARASVLKPNFFAAKYRKLIKQLMQEIILNKLSKEQAITHTHEWAEKNIIDDDIRKFIEEVDNLLMSTHEGSAIKFGIKPDEFHAWKAVWERR